MSYLAPAKLNLFLHVVGRRSDGYHLLQSVFTLIDFADALDFSPRSDGLIRRSNNLHGVAEQDDLVVRAATLLKASSGTKLGCDIAIEKRIPMGGGLGGGSSDAATTLMVLNQLWETRFTRAQLQVLGAELGADVPFFIFGRAAFAEGVGEQLTTLALPAWWYLVLTPPVGVPTALVFSAPELTRDSFPLKMADFSAEGCCLSGLRNARNDLQPVVVKAFPEVAHALHALAGVSQHSLFGARMTGSGASVFAAFSEEQQARDAFAQLDPQKHHGFIAKGLAVHPLG